VHGCGSLSVEELRLIVGRSIDRTAIGTESNGSIEKIFSLD